MILYLTILFQRMIKCHGQLLVKNKKYYFQFLKCVSFFIFLILRDSIFTCFHQKTKESIFFLIKKIESIDSSLWFQFISRGTFIYRKLFCTKLILDTQDQYKVFANYHDATEREGRKSRGYLPDCIHCCSVRLVFSENTFSRSREVCGVERTACEVPCVQVYEHPCRKWRGNYVCTFARVRHNISISARNVNYTYIYDSIIYT